MSKFQGFMLAAVLAVGGLAADGYAHPPKTVACNHTRDEVINGDVDKQHLVLTGRVGRLVLKGKVDGQSVLDLCGLVADKIVIEGRVDGQSQVLIGTVGDVHIGDKLDGQSTVNVARCRNFYVGGKIDGGRRTVVTVNYTGTATVREVKDSSATFNKVK